MIAEMWKVMRDSGFGDLGMDPTVSYSLEMVTLTWDPLRKTPDKGKVFTCGPMVEPMKANSTKISAMDEALSLLRMVLSMKVTLSWEKGMDMAGTASQMEVPMKENGKMDNMMDTGFSLGMMAECTQESGRVHNIMVEVERLIVMDKLSMMDFGSTTNQKGT